MNNVTKNVNIINKHIFKFIPENTALRIIPRRGFPLVECAHGNPCPGGKGKTCGPLFPTDDVKH